MRLTTSLLLALGALANAASFQSMDNPLVPIEGVLVAGKPTTIKWTPTTTGPITLQLRRGPAQNLGQGVVIAASVPNTGSVSWTPPADLPSKPDYAIQISNDANPAQVNYSPQFAISGTAAPPSTTSGSSSSTSASSTTSTPSMTSASTTNSAVSTTTSPGNSTTSATKSGPSTTVPGATGAAARLGQGIAVVVGLGTFVAGL
ncbi:GPI anchored protein [Venturia nashicola]|nr:GPI anchored protein [Venturia nashicola]